MIRRALAVLLLAASASSAGARVGGTTVEGVYRFPSDDIQNVGQLKNAVQSRAVRAIVVDPGTYDVGDGLFIAARDDLLICGRTGRPGDVVFTSSTGSVAAVEKARRISFRGVTLRTTADFSAALFLIAAPSSQRESYVEDVVVDRCVLEGYYGVQATVRTRNLTVTRSRVTLLGSNSATGAPKQGGAGVLWEDGPGLFVGRTKFTTDYQVPAVSAVLVRGAQTGSSEGGRARGIVLSGNTVSGDFAHGFDLADVVDARVRSNSLSFPSEFTTAGLPGIDAGSARLGIWVRRANASSLTEDFELTRNRVRRSFYGAWLLNTGQCVVRGNDFRACGSTTIDSFFDDHGAALRIGILGGTCRALVVGNDFRSLRSPLAEPAVVVSPEGSDAAACFRANRPNRVDRGRPVHSNP